MTGYTRRGFLTGSLLAPLAFALAGCGGSTDAAAPPAISYGRDTCDRCGMIVSDERMAGGLVGPNDTATVYDDVGELLQIVAEEGLGGRRAWVHDYHQGTWLDAGLAFYVRGKPELTPMGTGIVAFAKREDAEAFAAEHNETVLTWDEATRPMS